jgi:protein tyrosine phosphatase
MAEDNKDLATENPTHKIKFIHEALPNNIDKYETDRRDVKEWIIRLLKIFEELDPVNDFPVFVHCASTCNSIIMHLSYILRE